MKLVRALLQFAIYPLELVRTRLAVCPMGTYRGIWDCWGQIVRKEGWACFYRGLTPSLVSHAWCTLSLRASPVMIHSHTRDGLGPSHYDGLLSRACRYQGKSADDIFTFADQDFSVRGHGHQDL